MATFINFIIRLVDLSQNQDDPNTPSKPLLTKLINAGIKGIIIRVGFGLVLDRIFQWFWNLAKGKMPRKPYFYLDYYSHRKTGVTDADWGIEQAYTAYNALKGDYGEMPLALDCEESGYGGKITWLTRASYNRIARAFCETYERLTGREVEIYTSVGFMWVFDNWAKDRSLWVAWYNRVITWQIVMDRIRAAGWRGKVVLWQYTSDGDINNDGIADGIALGMESSGLDFNVFPGSQTEWEEYKNHAPDPVPTVEEPAPVTSPLTEKFKAQNISIYPLTTHTAASFAAPDFGLDVQPREIVSVYESLNGLWLIDPLKERWITASVTYMLRLEPVPVPVELTDAEKLSILWASFLKEHPGQIQ